MAVTDTTKKSDIFVMKLKKSEEKNPKKSKNHN